MLKLRLNKVKLKNHFRYYVWIYAAAMAIAGTLLNGGEKSVASGGKIIFLYMRRCDINVLFLHIS